MKTQRVHILAGPTASGKSSRAMAVARAAGGVIINADAMQCYAPLPILSAQPSVADRAALPHRLYGFLQPTDSINAAKWAELALHEIENVLTAGQLPIVCGGTGLYLKALTQGMAKIPDIDPAIRQSLQARLADEGLPKLYDELKTRDAALAARLKAGDTQRILRGLEVVIGTGRPLSEWQSGEHTRPPAYDFRLEIILPEREQLYENINHRTHQMIAMGVLDEVRAADIPPQSLAYKTLGYAEFRRHLTNEIPLDEAIELTQTLTRQYAKRQMTWWRNQRI